MTAKPYGLSYDGDMARKQVLVQLDDALVDELDRLAAELQVSRSELIRRSAEKMINALQEAEKVRAYVESYTNDPQTEEELAFGEAGVKLAAETWPEW